MEQHRPIVNDLHNLLLKHVVPSLTVQEVFFDPTSYDETSNAIARRYVSLLQAAIDPGKAMSMSLGSLEGFRYKLYFQVYYNLISWRGGKNFAGDDLHGFFPAIAIRNQMVAVPAGLGLKLKAPTERGSPLAALQAGGVQEIAFDSSNTLEPALKQVYAQLRSSFLRELQAYESYQGELQLTPARVAEDLGMDLDFVQQALKGELLAFDRSSYPGLRCQLAVQKLSREKWTKLELVIENHSKEDASNLSIQIGGPIKIRPSRLEASVRAGETTNVEFAMMPENSGEFPVEVRLTLTEIVYLVHGFRFITFGSRSSSLSGNIGPQLRPSLQAQHNRQAFITSGFA